MFTEGQESRGPTDHPPAELPDLYSEREREDSCRSPATDFFHTVRMPTNAAQQNVGVSQQ